MQQQLHIVRSVTALFLWVFSLWIAPQMQGEAFREQQQGTSAHFVTVADGFGFNCINNTLPQKGKDSKPVVITPLFVVEHSSFDVESHLLHLNEIESVLSRTTLTSHLLYTETTSSRL